MSPDVLATDALAAAGEIEDDDDRAEALTRLASMLPGPLLPEALDVALGIEDGQERARALAVREVRSGLPRTSCGRAGSSLRRGPRSCCRRSGHAACARRWRFAPPGESKPG